MRRVHATLHRALRDAVRWNLIGRNPADAADPPRAVGCAGAVVNVWSIADIKTFLTQRAGGPATTPCGFFSSPPACAGERPWDSAGRTSILRPIPSPFARLGCSSATRPSSPRPRPKKDGAWWLLIRRPLPLLRTCGPGAKKTARAREERSSRGISSLPTSRGSPFTRNGLTRLFRKASKKAGVPEIRLHDLRHTYASVALSAGVHPKVVSERLGHANIGITLDTYSHCLPALSEEAACRVAALVVPGSERE